MKYVLLPVIFLCTFSIASACSFTADADRIQPAESNIEKYDYAFVATIVEKKELEEFAGNEYTFNIHNFYVGAVIGFDETTGYKQTIASPGHSCGSFYSIGQVGLFFTNDMENIDESNPQYFFETKQEALEQSSVVFSNRPEPVDPNTPFEQVMGGKEKPIACTREYAPVCGEIQVQCVQAPCPPVQKTYSNNCVMEAQGAILVNMGACVADIKPMGPTETTQSIQEQVKGVQEVTNSFTAPIEGPLVGFVEPTTPPPVLDVVTEEQEKTGFFKEIRQWIVEKMSGLFSWFF